MRKIFSLTFRCSLLLVAVLHSFGVDGPVVGKGPTFHGLVSEQASVDGKKDFWIAWRIQRQPGWHTYWLHPGDVGLPPSIEWNLPKGVSAGPLIFPPPKRVMMGKIGAHGHHGETLFLCKISLSPAFKKTDFLSIKGKAAWLACSQTCLPGYSDLEMEVPVESENSIDRKWSPVFEKFRADLPVVPPSDWLRQAQAFDEGEKLRLVVPAEKSAAFSGLYFFAEGRTIRSNLPQPVRNKHGKWEIQMTRSPWSSKDETRLLGLLYRKDGWAGDSNCKFYQIDLPLL